MLKSLCDIDVNCEGLCKRTFRAAPNSEEFVSVCMYSRVRLIMRSISRCIAGSSSVKEARSNSSKSTPLISRSLKHVTTSPIFSSCMFSSLSTRLRSSLTSATFSDFTDRGLAASIFCLIPFQSACLIDACIYVEAGQNETTRDRMGSEISATIATSQMQTQTTSARLAAAWLSTNRGFAFESLRIVGQKKTRTC